MQVKPTLYQICQGTQCCSGTKLVSFLICKGMQFCSATDLPLLNTAETGRGIVNTLKWGNHDSDDIGVERS